MSSNILSVHVNINSSLILLVDWYVYNASVSLWCHCDASHPNAELNLLMLALHITLLIYNSKPRNICGFWSNFCGTWYSTEAALAFLSIGVFLVTTVHCDYTDIILTLDKKPQTDLAWVLSHVCVLHDIPVKQQKKVLHRARSRKEHNSYTSQQLTKNCFLTFFYKTRITHVGIVLFYCCGAQSYRFNPPTPMASGKSILRCVSLTRLCDMAQGTGFFIFRPRTHLTSSTSSAP